MSNVPACLACAASAKLPCLAHDGWLIKQPLQLQYETHFRVATRVRSDTFTATRLALMQPSYTRPVRPQPISADIFSSCKLQTSFGQAAGMSLQKTRTSCLTTHQLAISIARDHSCCRTQEAAVKAVCGTFDEGTFAGAIWSASLDLTSFPGCSASLHSQQILWMQGDMHQHDTDGPTSNFSDKSCKSRSTQQAGNPCACCCRRMMN